MADYTSGSINFSGLGNGTDFNALIDGLVNVEKRRVTRLETWRSSWETKDAYFKELNTQMLSLRTTLEGFDTTNEFLAKSVNSTNTTLLTATANKDAREGTHTIEIGQLAANDVHITASGASSLDAAVTSTDTSFTYSYGGESFTLSNVGAGTTLASFVNLINNHPDSRDNIRASTIFDGSVYHLQLAGLDQGGDKQLVISNAGSMIFTGSDFNETQDAQNSQIRINGFPSSGGGWIERSSNSINDVVEGVTLNLNDAEVGTSIQLNVTTDTAKVKENIESFVDSINVIRKQIQAITRVEKTDDKVSASILTGNYGVDIVSQNLRNITAEGGQGFIPYDADTGLGDIYSSLAQIGITTDVEEGSETYGLLKINYDGTYNSQFDATMPGLNDALEKDPQAVAELFSAYNLGKSQSPDFTFNSLIDGTTKPGVYEVEVVSDGTAITSATINGVAAKVSGWTVTAMSGDALGMGFTLDNKTAGTHTGDISIKLGKTGEMINELKALTKPFNEHTHEGGTMAVLRENYADIMDSIDDKIEYENNRITKLEKSLKLKFARLDALLGQYELKQGQLASSIKQLGQ